MQAKAHMPLDHFQGGSPALRQPFEMIEGPLNPFPLDGVNEEGIVFPLKDPIQGSAGRLVNMQKQQSLAGQVEVSVGYYIPFWIGVIHEIGPVRRGHPPADLPVTAYPKLIIRLPKLTLR